MQNDFILVYAPRPKISSIKMFTDTLKKFVEKSNKKSEANRSNWNYIDIYFFF